MNFHKKENNDIIKLIPFRKKEGGYYMRKKYDCIYHKSTIICDPEFKYLRRLAKLMNSRKQVGHLEVLTIHSYGIYINGEFKIMNAGRSIDDIINSYIYNTKINIFDIKENIHLFIKSEPAGPLYFDLKKSYMGEYNWTPPFSTDTIRGREEWTNAIDSQPSIDDYLDENSVFSKIHSMKEIFGDGLSEIISEDRDRKIDLLI